MLHLSQQHLSNIMPPQAADETTFITEQSHLGVLINENKPSKAAPRISVECFSFTKDCNQVRPSVSSPDFKLRPLKLDQVDPGCSQNPTQRSLHSHSDHSSDSAGGPKKNIDKFKFALKMLMHRKINIKKEQLAWGMIKEGFKAKFSKSNSPSHRKESARGRPVQERELNVFRPQPKYALPTNDLFQRRVIIRKKKREDFRKNLLENRSPVTVNKIN